MSLLRHIDTYCYVTFDTDMCQHLLAHYDNVWNAKYQNDPKGTSILQGRFSPTTERRYATCSRRLSHAVSVENGPLKIAPPSLSVEAPPGWFLMPAKYRKR